MTSQFINLCRLFENKEPVVYLKRDAVLSDERPIATLAISGMDHPNKTHGKLDSRFMESVH